MKIDLCEGDLDLDLQHWLAVLRQILDNINVHYNEEKKTGKKRKKKTSRKQRRQRNSGRFPTNTNLVGNYRLRGGRIYRGCLPEKATSKVDYYGIGKEKAKRDFPSSY